MKKTTKAWLITAAVLVVSGCGLFAGVMSTLGWNFAKLSTVKYTTHTYAVDEPFDSLSLTTDTADIVLALSDDGKCRIECREEENAGYTVTVDNNTLTVMVNNRKTWYDYTGIHFDSPKITVYLPKTDYTALFIRENTGNVEIPKEFTWTSADISVSTGDVHFFSAVRETVGIKTSTGGICVEDISAGALTLSVATGGVTVSDVTCEGEVTVGVSTGRAELTNVACGSLVSTGTTGDITLEHVTAGGKLSVRRSTGHVGFSRCDAAELHIQTSTGDVTGSLLTGKVFATETATGSVEIPHTAEGGRCEIKTATGNIRITIA